MSNQPVNPCFSEAGVKHRNQDHLNAKTRHLSVLAAAVFSQSVTLAGPDVPAQPVTNLRTPSSIDPMGDADPFNIVQLDDRLLFLARNNQGYALYVRNLVDPTDPGSPDPAIEWTAKKLRPKVLRPFKKNQVWDLNARNVVRI